MKNKYWIIIVILFSFIMLSNFSYAYSCTGTQPPEEGLGHWIIDDGLTYCTCESGETIEIYGNTLVKGEGSLKINNCKIKSKNLNVTDRAKATFICNETIDQTIYVDNIFVFDESNLTIKNCFVYLNKGSQSVFKVSDSASLTAIGRYIDRHPWFTRIYSNGAFTFNLTDNSKNRIERYIVGWDGICQGGGMFCAKVIFGGNSTNYIYESDFWIGYFRDYSKNYFLDSSVKCSWGVPSDWGCRIGSYLSPSDTLLEFYGVKKYIPEWSKIYLGRIVGNSTIKGNVDVRRATVVFYWLSDAYVARHFPVYAYQKGKSVIGANVVVSCFKDIQKCKWLYDKLDEDLEWQGFTDSNGYAEPVRQFGHGPFPTELKLTAKKDGYYSSRKIGFFGTTPVKLYHCSGDPNLVLPENAEPSSTVKATVEGLNDFCFDVPVSIRESSCSGNEKCSCNLNVTSCDCEFDAPSSEGTYTYYGCIDKNQDGDFNDEGESTSTTLTVETKKQNGEPCSSNDECQSTYCVHSVCRPTDPYCGDGYCDSGETCSSCPKDCGTCPSGGGGGGGPVGPVCGNDKCESGEDYINCPQDCPGFGIDIEWIRKGLEDLMKDIGNFINSIVEALKEWGVMK